MTSGLLRRPEPPHDPRSLLLNGIVGFRKASRSPDRLESAIMLARYSLDQLPAAQRHALQELTSDCDNN